MTRRGLVRALAIGLLLAAGVGLALLGLLRASLPQLDGERRVAGLEAAVRVERDALGVPSVHGRSRLDVARATGFLHAQDRFFQMDLLRRKAAGELAELVGPAALPVDRRSRVHRFRDVAQRTLRQTSPELQALVAAYASGVNAGLSALSARPFEYLVLRSRPVAWKPEDTVLVSLAMFLELQDDAGQFESTLGVMRDTLPASLFAFLAPLGTEWDAPLVGEAAKAVPLPGPEVVDLRAGPPPPVRSARLFASEPLAAGSNNWAVAGKISSHGGAMVADDMHLGLSVPNTWYRMSLEWPGHRITGVTLPGTPAVVVGSTGQVAWGFTNSEGDWVDLIELELDAKDPESYATPQGPRRFDHVRELIHVKGGADEILDVTSTVWGPVIDRDHNGRPRALRWVAHEPSALNLGLLRLEDARNLDDALGIAAGAGSPEQNFMCADSAGRIGWTIAGAIPRRVGYDGRTPTSWADGSRRWDGWLAPEEYPRVVDPADGRLWTANARVEDGDALVKIGYGSYELGARARQIRDDLRSLPLANEAALQRIQLDAASLFLNRWHDLLVRTVHSEPGDDTRRSLALAQAGDWPGEAATGSVAYRLVRAFRLAVMEEALSPLFEPCRKADAHFDAGRLHQSEAPLWRLITERPAHLLNPRYHSWDELLLAALDKAVASLGRDRGGDGTWGERNTVAIRHPLSRALPWLSRWLDVPSERLPGDINMPRVQTPTHGASERLVVSPGHESSGLFHMPAGQSGHPLSPFYRAGHEAWARGEPTPFLPGPAIHVLTLSP